MRKRLSALLLAAAMVCGLTACGSVGWKTSIPTPEAVDGPRTIDADVVIVGAGGAGMTAGVVAARAGKKVVILEKTSVIGGNSARATGGMNAAVTKYQNDNGWNAAAGLERTLRTATEDYPELADLTAVVQKEYDDWRAGPNGYFDSVGLFILDTMVAGENRNDLELVTTLVENSVDAIDWLDSIGGSLHNVGFFGGTSVWRTHRPADGKGRAIAVGPYLVSVLEQACIDNGVEILLDAPVTEILMDDGKAVGVQAGEITVNARAVILATGGFGADPDMITEQDPQLEGFATSNASGATGDGIRMAQAVGAATVDLAEIQILPFIEQNTSAPITEDLREDGAILVNAEGLRFCDETDTRDAVSAAELQQTGGYAWLVVDQNMVDASSVMDDYIAKGYTVQGNTYAKLASVMGVPYETFTETMEGWNTAVANHRDEEFGRTGFSAPLDAAPFYAIKVVPGVYHTMGGVKINSFAEVMDTDDAVIPGLFAAGEVTGGIHGANCLDGNAVTECIVFGRIAGESAAACAE